MDEGYDLETAKQRLTQYLEQCKMRKTVERYAILEAVYNAGKHVTADSICTMLEDCFRVSRGTVYNTLEVLYRANLVVRHQFGNVIEYEARTTGAPHYHLVCTECGMTSEFYNEPLVRTMSCLKRSGFTIAGHAIYVYGTCTKCRLRLARMKKKQLNNNKKTL